MKIQIRLLGTIVAFLCLPFLPNALALMPPPDGGYPGGNTAEGQNALLTLTTGTINTAVGFFSLRSDTVAQRVRPMADLKQANLRCKWRAYPQQL